MQGVHRNHSVRHNIASLQEMFEKVYKNFAYRLLELQMTIDESGISIGQNKKEDISQLIQLYMIGVQVLESTGDSRFGYFRTKIHDLMLKKEVIKQLKFSGPEEILKRERAVMQQKRKQHQTKLAKTQEQEARQANSIINTAATTMENYKESMQNMLKKQQNQIKQRLNSRGKRSQSSGSSIPKPTAVKKQASNGQRISTEFCTPPPVPKNKKQFSSTELKSVALSSSPLQKSQNPDRSGRDKQKMWKQSDGA